jgi:hypothetical protein
MQRVRTEQAPADVDVATLELFSLRSSVEALVHHEGAKYHEDEQSPEGSVATESPSHRENVGLRALDAAPRSGGSGTKPVR